jgi:3-hydroxyacyl-CoA dehydrogenase
MGRTWSGDADYAVSNSGTLVYEPDAGTKSGSLFVMVDRQGQVKPISARGNYGEFSISPDGRALATRIFAINDDIWINNIANGTLVRFTSDLDVAVTSSGFVQECAPERVELKRELLQQAATRTEADVPLASSSSAIAASRIAEGLDAAVAARIVVGHPGNPPYLLPVIEVVPSPVTSDAISERATEVYRAAGLRPVLVRREVEGFLFNRLQGALLREAYCLVRDGVASVDDVDEVVRSGLGRRWAVIGPFETSDLNTRGGIESHAAKMGPAYERMGAERGQHDPWTPELVAEVTAQRRALVDLDDWDERVRWRDAQLIRMRDAL